MRSTRILRTIAPHVSSNGIDTSPSKDFLNHYRASKSKKWIAFSIYACHPCAGAMLIFSVSFQISSMSSGFP